jgi:hypothetical protein
MASSKTVLVRYRYRIYPSPGQQHALARTFGCARVVFNDSLFLREQSRASGEKLSDSEIQRRVVTLAKLTPQRAWLAEVPSVALVQACNDARRAYRNWFDSLSGKRKGRKIGHPRFRRKHGRQSIRLTRNGFSLHGGWLYVAKAGQIRVRWSRPLPSEPSSVTVSREPDGRYYASFVVERAAAPLPACEREIGIDLGLDRLAVTSEGEIIANPRIMRAKERHLSRAQRALSRRQKDSANRAKARRRVAVLHRKVRETRLDHAHKTALRLVRDKPSGLRRRPRRQRACPDAAGQVRSRCRLVAAAAPAGREGGALRADVPPDRSVRAHLAGVLGMLRSGRSQAAERSHLDVRGVRRVPRPGRERRKKHTRRRAGGEAKRLWRDGKTGR